MGSAGFSVPVLFLVFNRPDMTARVFDAIRQVAPRRLYVASDGAREDHSQDHARVETVRKIVMAVDWDCDVRTLFRDKNLGCKKAVSSAIDWFFENEEEGIILEDDCLPDSSFFPFCAELLEKYRHDERVMMISGDNFQKEKTMMPYSYYFSKYCHIWGWATWRRAWKHYDVNMRLWPEVQKNGSWSRFLDVRETRYWQRCFDDVFSGQIDTWDFQWLFACWVQNGLAVLPGINLVSNIGFNKDGAHTRKKNFSVHGLKTRPVTFPLKHPPYIVHDKRADDLTRNIFFRTTVRDFIKNIFGSLFMGCGRK